MALLVFADIRSGGGHDSQLLRAGARLSFLFPTTPDDDTPLLSPTRPFSRHAILVSGMAIKDALTCWPNLRRTFLDGGGAAQDTYVVLGLGGNGSGPPTQSEQEVIDFFAADPVVRAVYIDTHPYNSPPVGRLQPIAPHYPWWHKVIETPTPELERVKPSTTMLSQWKTYLAWELMENTTRPHGHEYGMVVRVRPDLFLPDYAYDGWKRHVDLDAFMREGDAPVISAEGTPHLASLGCENLHYDSWGLDNPVVPESQLIDVQFRTSRGQCVLPSVDLPEGRIVKSRIFFSYYSVYTGGFNDYFAWGRREDMRRYHASVLSMDEIMEKSKIMLVTEAIKKYALLLALRRLEADDGVAGKITYALQVTPCSRVVYCLTKWYEGPPDPSICSYDNPGIRWPALLEQG
jgi:hypothetical protein